MAKDQIDQDALAAEWGVALEAEQAEQAASAAESNGAPADGLSAEDAAAQWSAMTDDGTFLQAAKGGAERILTQEEIDSLLGFQPRRRFAQR